MSTDVETVNKNDSVREDYGRNYWRGDSWGHRGSRDRSRAPATIQH